MDAMSNVSKMRDPRDYIEVEQWDIELEEALREAYAVNGPVISIIAQFREMRRDLEVERLRTERGEFVEAWKGADWHALWKLYRKWESDLARNQGS